MLELSSLYRRNRRGSVARVGCAAAGDGPVRIDRKNTKAPRELGAIAFKGEGERRSTGVITKGLGTSPSMHSSAVQV